MPTGNGLLQNGSEKQILPTFQGMPSNTASSLDCVGRAVFTPMAKTYYEKLKDPRWQKKRLQIMDRDKFSCRYCGNSERTLNVHHLLYEKGANPWDYESNLLVTLCEKCHEMVEFRWRIIRSNPLFLRNHDPLILLCRIIGGLTDPGFVEYHNTIKALSQLVMAYDPSLHDKGNLKEKAVMRKKVKQAQECIQKLADSIPSK
jgi:hypothetical protein